MPGEQHEQRADVKAGRGPQVDEPKVELRAKEVHRPAMEPRRRGDKQRQRGQLPTSSGDIGGRHVVSLPPAHCGAQHAAQR